VPQVAKVLSWSRYDKFERFSLRILWDELHQQDWHMRVKSKDRQSQIQQPWPNVDLKIVGDTERAR
jgi:hypothetical protein